MLLPVLALTLVQIMQSLVDTFQWQPKYSYINWTKADPSKPGGTVTTRHKVRFLSRVGAPVGEDYIQFNSLVRLYFQSLINVTRSDAAPSSIITSCEPKIASTASVLLVRIL